MKIQYDRNYEKDQKELLYDILCEYFLNHMDITFDALGCEPACRDESSPGCDFCIKYELKRQIEEGNFKFFPFESKEYIFYHKKDKKYYNYNEIKIEEEDYL